MRWLRTISSVTVNSRRGARPVRRHQPRLMSCLSLALEDEAAAHLLGGDHVLQDRVAVGLEAEQDERLADDRVLAVERQDLQCQVGAVALLGQPLQLLVHRAVRADPAQQDRLIEHHVEPQANAVEHLLAAQPHPDEPGHLGQRIGSTRSYSSRRLSA